MEQLARAITDDDDFKIVNRTFGLTKSQMVKQVPGDYDEALAPSVSCDTGFSHHEGGEAPTHCGGCTSCVLRRQALAAAERNIPTPARGVPQRKEEHLKLMAWQVARLHHVLRDGFDWTRMVREFPRHRVRPRILPPRPPRGPARALQGVRRRVEPSVSDQGVRRGLAPPRASQNGQSWVIVVVTAVPVAMNSSTTPVQQSPFRDLAACGRP